MNRQQLEKYVSDINELDGNVEILTDIRPTDLEKLYLCDIHANVNADILTAFYSPISINVEIIFTQNVIDLQPTNKYCRFVQRIEAGIRTIPVCGPIILCANAFTAIYIKSDNDSLQTLKCYGISMINLHEIRLLKRHTIFATTKVPNVILKYENGFVEAHEKDDTMNITDRFFIVPNTYYDY
jgi:hypothetical protein